MQPSIRLKPDVLPRLREIHRTPSEDAQARLIGVDRGTLRRINNGASPSAAFIAGVMDAYGLPFEFFFEVVTTGKRAVA